MSSSPSSLGYRVDTLKLHSYDPRNRIEELIAIYIGLIGLFEGEPDATHSDDTSVYARAVAAGESTLKWTFGGDSNALVDWATCGPGRGGTGRRFYAMDLRVRLTRLCVARDEIANGRETLPDREHRVRRARNDAISAGVIIGSITWVVLSLSWPILKDTVALPTGLDLGTMAFGVTWGEFLLSVLASLVAAAIAATVSWSIKAAASQRSS